MVWTAGIWFFSQTRYEIVKDMGLEEKQFDTRNDVLGTWRVKQRSWYYSPKQFTIKGKSLKHNIDLQCLNRPKMEIFMIRQGFPPQCPREQPSWAVEGVYPVAHCVVHCPPLTLQTRWTTVMHLLSGERKTSIVCKHTACILKLYFSKIMEQT